MLSGRLVSTTSQTSNHHLILEGSAFPRLSLYVNLPGSQVFLSQFIGSTIHNARVFSTSLGCMVNIINEILGAVVENHQDFR